MFARMLSLGATLVAAAAVTAPAFGAHDAEDLVSIDKRMQRAFVDRDVATLEKILTEDYVLVLPSGTERTRAPILADVASPDIVFEINESSGWEVRVHGDTGIVVALLHQKGTSHGQAFDHVVKFSDTYVREHGVWRNVHAHASRITEPPKPAT
jgi:ketosteroid isomerase-like protein